MQAVDPFMAKPGIQRGRGGFMRGANDVPWVTDPLGETCKSGARKGEVKRIPYGQPSSVGRLIENDVGLTKHKQRMTLLGIGMDEGLREACKALSDLEPGSDEFRKAADTIVVEADNLTRSWLAADRGSHGHLLCERWDKKALHPDLYRAGEALGLEYDTQLDVMGEWTRLLENNGLEILAIEASCVDDRWRLAGTLDRIVRCTRELRFAMPDGQIVAIPAGTVLILDIKFGLIRRAHLIQVASYRQSVPYDTEAEVRGEWPWEISAEHALIAHGDFGGDGVPVTFELVWVDLAAGREHGGETVVQAKAWSARDDLWSIAQLDVEGVSGVAPQSTFLTPSTQDSPDTPTVPVTAGDAVSADPTPSPATLLVPLRVDHCLTPDPERIVLVDARATLTTDPDEGADLAVGFDELWANLKALFDALDPAARSWRGELVNAAQRHLVPFHAQQVRTERTYQINRGLIALALAGGDNDELLRALLALIVGDAALFPGIEAGHVLGSLNATEAERFAALVDAWVGDHLVSYVDDGCLRYREPINV